MTTRSILVLTALVLAACAVGPDYRRPEVPVSADFKEAREWKQAEPREAIDRGRWWAIYGDPVLDGLEAQVGVGNQSLKQAEATFRAARALAEQAQASLWPVLSASAGLTRSQSGAARVTGAPSAGITTLRTAELDASWEIDLWGGLRRAAEVGRESARASHGDLEAARLSLQAQLASDYFQLRAADATRHLLDETLTAFEKSTQITRNQYAAGVAAKSDVMLAEEQLESARAQALDVDVGRAQLEHAIAVLIGKTPAEFTLAPGGLDAKLPGVPLGLPSDLLERRPDVAAAERRVASANAQVGVVTAAFFPTLTLAAAGGFQSTQASHWFSLPNRYWSVGPTLAETLFDFGKRSGVSAQARAEYEVAVATYRQTVLASFQSVEDNVAALRILEAEAGAQDAAVAHARQVVELTLNQYKAGTVSFLSVVTVQATALADERAAVSILGRRFAASVALVAALGGGWNAPDLHATLN
jgi:NodT family efflux transporter outer membrane factor (OMF) lipoprotein